MSKEVLRRYADLYRENCRNHNFEYGNYEIVDCGSWKQEGKYQLRQVVVQFDGVYIALYQSRSGSYHTDWEGGATLMQIVERNERQAIVIDWTGTGTMVEVLPDWS